MPSNFIKPKITDFRQGLNTSVPDESHEIAWRTFQNVRTDSGAAKRRAGHVRIARIVSDDSIIDFDGTNDKFTFPYHASVTGFHLIPKWTIEGLTQIDSLSSTRTILEKGHSPSAVYVYATSASGGTVTAEVLDTSGNPVVVSVTGIAAGTLFDWRVSWDGATTVTLDVNGSSSTGTSSTGILATDTGSMTVGAQTSANYLDGRTEFVRIFRGVKSRGQDCRSRLVNPRQPSCLFDCVFNATDFARDRGRYEMIGTATGSPSTTATLLSNNPVPIQAIAQAQSGDGIRRVYIIGAGKVYPATV